MSQDKRKRAVVYLRVSLVDLNPNNQKIPIARYCEAHGIEIVGFFLDRMSGRSDDRPQLRKALAALKEPDIDLMVCFAIDRLARSVAHVIRIVNDVRSSKKGLIILRENLDLTGTSPASDLVLHIFSALAEFEAALISERTKVALAVARLQGQTLGRPRKVSPEIEAQVLELRSRGIAIREIARRIPEISRGSVQAVMRRAKNKS